MSREKKVNVLQAALALIAASTPESSDSEGQGNSHVRITKNCEVHGRCDHYTDECPEASKPAPKRRGRPPGPAKAREPKAGGSERKKKVAKLTQHQGIDHAGDSSNDSNDEEEGEKDEVQEKDFTLGYDDGEDAQQEPSDGKMKWSKFEISKPEAIETRGGLLQTPEIPFPAWKGAFGGSTVKNQGLTEPHHYMELFFDDFVISTFVRETNSFAKAQGRKKWVETTKEEMKGFLGIVMILGIQKFPQRSFAWDPSLFGSRYCLQSMSNSRFNSILSCLHWKDGSSMTAAERKLANKQNPWWSVEGYVQYLAARFRACYRMAQRGDIDEITIGFKGRHRCKCYNPNKPNKWHFKAFGLNCSETCYLYDFFLYQGKDEKRPEGVTATEYPVLKLLTDDFNHWNHVIATDNWYTSVNLSKQLLERGIHTIGTIRTNKTNVPPEGVIPKTGKGKKTRGFMHSFRTAVEVRRANLTKTEHIYFTGWQDSKPVHMLHTFPVFADAVPRNLTDATGTYTPMAVPCPSVIPQYNQIMGGTDGHDQLTSYYLTSVNKKKWQPKILFYFMHVSMVNAHILFKLDHQPARGKPNQRLLSFIQSVALSWKTVSIDSRRTRYHHHTSTYGTERRVGLHTPFYRQGTRGEDGKQSNPRRKCIVCKEALVQTGCVQCDAALCFSRNYGDSPVETCWEIHHN